MRAAKIATDRCRALCEQSNKFVTNSWLAFREKVKKLLTAFAIAIRRGEAKTKNSVKTPL
ncbi:MAG: hypothetical protein DMF00_13845 [Verrucomicrobia bacterium]|nr:MAG: hypothetical protein DMF00_13845 [Verrucomicrobiota bacterium]